MVFQFWITFYLIVRPQDQIVFKICLLLFINEISNLIMNLLHTKNLKHFFGTVNVILKLFSFCHFVM